MLLGRYVEGWVHVCFLPGSYVAEVSAKLVLMSTDSLLLLLDEFGEVAAALLPERSNANDFANLESLAQLRVNRQYKQVARIDKRSAWVKPAGVCRLVITCEQLAYPSSVTPGLCSVTLAVDHKYISCRSAVTLRACHWPASTGHGQVQMAVVCCWDAMLSCKWRACPAVFRWGTLQRRGLPQNVLLQGLPRCSRSSVRCLAAWCP